MFGEMTGSWMFVALIETCAGSAMALYGWKQREPVPLAFGVALTIVPCIIYSAWLSALIGLGLVVLFFVVQREFG